MFILGLKGLSSPKRARRGMQLAACGMLLAVLGTLFDEQIVNYRWILLGFITGSVVGGGMGLRIPMTAVPQRTALSHSLGALAGCLVGIAEFILFQDINRVKLTALDFEVVVGALTFTGSLIAAAKLQELLPGRPITYKGQNFFSIVTLGVVAAIGIFLVAAQTQSPFFYLMVGLAFLFGLMLVIPIGAADMPTVIALLNSYGGLADASMGFVLMNKIQIITGSLDGTSGFLLALLMCRAMNRSAMNVLFGAFGQVASEDEAARAAAEKGTIRSITAEEVSTLFETATSVIIVPGYGMAVAQAQHAVAELANILQERKIDVKYAIHPVAGRMPGHMNVLLAEEGWRVAPGWSARRNVFASLTTPSAPSLCSARFLLRLRPIGLALRALLCEKGNRSGVLNLPRRKITWTGADFQCLTAPVARDDFHGAIGPSVRGIAGK